MPIELGSFSLGSTVGGVIGVVAGHFLTKSRDTEQRRIQHFNNTAAVFREAFVPELAELKSPTLSEPTDIYHMLVTAFDKHRTATHIFRFALPEASREQFDRVWHKYYSYDETQKESADYLIKYAPGWSGKTVQECRNLAITNIEKLLDFAHHK